MHSAPTTSSLAVGRDGFEERLRTGGKVPVEGGLAFVRKYAAVRPGGVETDAAVERATLCVESHGDSRR